MVRKDALTPLIGGIVVAVACLVAILRMRPTEPLGRRSEVDGRTAMRVVLAPKHTCLSS